MHEPVSKGLEARTDGGSVHAIPNAGHDTTDNQMGEGVSAGLQRSTDNHDDRAKEDGLATTQVVPNPDTEDGTEEATQVVRGGSDTWEVNIWEPNWMELGVVPCTVDRVLFSAAERPISPALVVSICGNVVTKEFKVNRPPEGSASSIAINQSIDYSDACLPKQVPGSRTYP